MDSDLAAQAKDHLTKTTISYPEYLKRLTAGSYTPQNGSQTHWGIALSLLDQIIGTPGWILDPPQAPITTISNKTGVGVLVVGGANAYSDYVIDGTTDSAVLLGPECGGSSFTRFHMTRAASLGSGPGYGRHGFYIKAPNVLIKDCYCQGDPNAKDIGSAFSIRFAGTVIEEFETDFLFFASLFDDDPANVAGPVTFRNGKAKFYADTAIWADTAIPSSVLIQNVAFTGPTDFVFKCATSFVNAGGTLKLEGVTINGKPAGSSNVGGLPSNRLTVS